MVIGGLLGRSSADGDDQPAIRAVARYREHFLEQFGYTQCGELREKVVDASCGPGSCAALVEEAAAILMAVLDETA